MYVESCPCYIRHLASRDVHFLPSCESQGGARLGSSVESREMLRLRLFQADAWPGEIHSCSYSLISRASADPPGAMRSCVRPNQEFTTARVINLSRTRSHGVLTSICLCSSTPSRTARVRTASNSDDGRRYHTHDTGCGGCRRTACNAVLLSLSHAARCGQLCAAPTPSSQIHPRFVRSAPCSTCPPPAPPSPTGAPSASPVRIYVQKNHNM